MNRLTLAALLASLPLAACATYSGSSMATLSDAAQERDEAGGGGDAAAAAQNPIANNISLPFEASIYPKAGLEEDDAFVLNIQPVIPAKLNEDWNLISRPIIPIMDLPGSVGGLPEVPSSEPSTSDVSGLGDINYTAFVSPSKAGKLIWGIGPSISIPTASDPTLGSEKWSIGPSVVGLSISQPWVYGLLWRQLWSFAGESDRDYVDQMILQPFANYNLAKGWYLHTSPVFVANWNAPGDQRWTVPLGGGVGKLFKIGKQPVNTNVQYYYNVEKPDNGAEWQVRLVLQFMFKK